MTEHNQTEKPETKKTRRVPNELLIFVVLAGMILAISYKPSVKAIYCNTETLTPKPDIIMLSTTWCPYCDKARRYFINNEISYCEYDIKNNAKGKQMYDDVNSHENQTGMPLGVPILFIGKYQFSGFNEDSIKKILASNKAL